MSSYKKIGNELKNILDENPHLVDNYTALYNAQKYIQKNEVGNAFHSIQIDMDKFLYVFPEVVEINERFKKNI